MDLAATATIAALFDLRPDITITCMSDSTAHPKIFAAGALAKPLFHVKQIADDSSKTQDPQTANPLR